MTRDARRVKPQKGEKKSRRLAQTQHKKKGPQKRTDDCGEGGAFSNEKKAACPQDRIKRLKARNARAALNRPIDMCAPTLHLVARRARHKSHELTETEQPNAADESDDQSTDIHPTHEHE